VIFESNCTQEWQKYYLPTKSSCVGREYFCQPEDLDQSFVSPGLFQWNIYALTSQTPVNLTHDQVYKKMTSFLYSAGVLNCTVSAQGAVEILFIIYHNLLLGISNQRYFLILFR
jgi:L-rhamnose mutarotase